jgi:hemolysin III
LAIFFIMARHQTLHPTSGYTRAEEIANSVTHGLGIVLSVVALVLCVVYSSLLAGPYMITASAIYGTSMVLLYTASTLYHSARDLRWKRRFLILDHACIYLLIAGTYTPFTLGPLRGAVGWTLFGIVWGLALLGVLKEILFTQRGGLWSSMIYLAMGWLMIGFVFPLYLSLSTTAFVLVVVGGCVYSLGVIFYLWKRLKFSHAIWHLFVVGGTVVQFFAILTVVLQGGGQL